MLSPKTLILKIYENKTACPVPLIQSLQQVTTQEKGEDSARWMEEAMAPHSSTLAWKIPWTEEPGRLQSMGC